jgi:NurA-like 5'-3' nuclease
MNTSKWRSLEDSVSTARKALQLLRFLDLMYSARKTIVLDDQTHRITLTMSRIATSFYYLTDNIVYLARIGVIDVDRNKWFKTSYRFWLYALIMNLLRDAYEIQLCLKKIQRRRILHNKEDIFYDVLKVLRDKPAISVDTLKNSCDILIPLSSLNHLPHQLTPRLIGILGAISSICSLLQLTQPDLRLTPC